MTVSDGRPKLGPEPAPLPLNPPLIMEAEI